RLVPISLFFLYAPATPASYTLSLHDALPISCRERRNPAAVASGVGLVRGREAGHGVEPHSQREVKSSPLPRACGGVERDVRQNADRKSTRLNSSHRTISYAVFCLKKKKNKTN